MGDREYIDINSFSQNQNQRQNPYQYPPSKPPKKKSSCILTFAIILIVVLVVGGGAFYCTTKTLSNVARQITENSFDNTTEINRNAASNTNEASFDNSSEINRVIYNSEDLKISYKGMTHNSLSTKIKLMIENKTSKKLLISSTSIVIDGYSIDAVLWANVAAGTKSATNIDLLNSYLKDNGLSFKTINHAETEVTIYYDDDFLNSTEKTISFSLR